MQSSAVCDHFLEMAKSTTDSRKSKATSSDQAQFFSLVAGLAEKLAEFYENDAADDMRDLEAAASRAKSWEASIVQEEADAEQRSNRAKRAKKAAIASTEDDNDQDDGDGQDNSRGGDDDDDGDDDNERRNQESGSLPGTSISISHIRIQR